MACNLPETSLMIDAVPHLHQQIEHQASTASPQTCGAGGGNQYNFSGPMTCVQTGNNSSMVINIHSNSHRGTSTASSHRKEKKTKKKVTVRDAEVDADVLAIVTRDIGTAWRELGRQLGLGDADLDVIYHDHRAFGLREIAHQMLREWHERKGRDASLEVLAKALVKIHKSEIAEALGTS